MGDLLYPFGYGLSCTILLYSNLQVKNEDESGQVRVAVTVRNTGHFSGEEVAQFYICNGENKCPSPPRSLVGLQRISLDAGESGTLQASFSPDTMEHPGIRDIRSGKNALTVGGHAKTR